jgi:predicted kinase
MIYLTIGIPASGKTTYALDIVSKQENTVRVCRDDIRFMIKNSPMLTSGGEKLVTTIVENTIKSAHANGWDIIVDQTNCNLQSFNKMMKFCRSITDVTLVTFDIKLEEALARNAQRDRQVPESVIKKMHGSLRSVTSKYSETTYSRVRYARYVPDEHLPAAVIFDIDGTLAITGNRSPYDWSKVEVDSANRAVFQALIAYYRAGYSILIFSGRDSVCRPETIKWLNRYATPYNELHMRPEGDMRPDTEIKREMLGLASERYNIVSVFDDRKSVKKMWVDSGLFVFDCNQRDEDF